VDDGRIAGLNPKTPVEWEQLRRRKRSHGEETSNMSMHAPQRIAIALVLGMAATTIAAFAHGGKSHRLLGTVKQLHESHLTVTDTDQVDHTVELTAETKLEKAGKPATREDLVAGTRVSIHLSEDDKVAVLVKIAGGDDTHSH
jgi:hypothetical protein